MIRGNLKNIIQLFHMFGTQSKGKRNYINIGKIIQQQEQSKTVKSSMNINLSLKNRPLSNIEQHPKQSSDIHEQWDLPLQKQGSHMSSEQQQMNHKIKSAIRCSSLYYECTKRKHKLQMRHYALMFCKILQLRKGNVAERKDDEDFINFLSVIQKKLDEMPPEQLVRMVHAMKYENVTKHELRLLMPIIERLINEFSNSPNSELQPKSYQTLRLSTNIKLFHSLLFILQQTGSHYEKKLKLLMNQTLNYILFKSMKTKKHSKGGEYFPLGLKISFLFSCGQINTSNACIKNLILSILVQRERLTLENLLDVEAILFESTEVLDKTRKQLFTEKDIHTKYNILYRIQKYIAEHFPSNLKKTNTYSLLNQKIVNHLTLLSKLTLQELNVLQMTTARDDHQYRILCLYHQAYKKFLIQDYSSISEKEDVITFFHKSENIEYSLYHLLNFFYSKLSNEGVNALRPTVKKQLKEFINLLTKFFNKLNFLTQSLIIKLLVLSNYTSLKPITTEYLQLNTFVTASRRVERPHFFTRDKNIMANNFFEMINYQKVFKQHCPGQYQVFVNSNIKNILKYLFKSKEQVNVQKYAFQLAQYCQTLSSQSLQSFINQVIQSYLRLSSLNRSFKKEDVDTLYKNKQYFLSTNIANHQTELQNQTDIFGTNILSKEQKDNLELERLLPTLANDKQVLRQHYDLQQKIRQKLRITLRNFKFIVLFLQNIKLTFPNHQTLINQELYISLLQNFKSEMECLKFQRVFTKENCSDLTQIHQFLNDIWQQTLSKVQVRNQSLMHKHEQIKNTHEVKLESSHEKQTQLQTLSSQNNKPQQSGQLNKNTQQMEVLDQDEEQSQQAQYTEQIEYLKGKDLLSLQTFKQYALKLTKSSEYFLQKNKKIIQQIQQLTNDFTSFPKDFSKSQQKNHLLKILLNSYSPNNNLSNETVLRNIKLIDLPTIDETNIQRENLKQLLNIQVQNNQNRQIYSLRVFEKHYPAFVHFGLTKYKSINQSDRLIPTVYYVNTSQMRKNYKRKQMETNHIQNQQINQQKEQMEEHKINSTQTGFDNQNPKQKN